VLLGRQTANLHLVLELELELTLLHYSLLQIGSLLKQALALVLQRAILQSRAPLYCSPKANPQSSQVRLTFHQALWLHFQRDLLYLPCSYSWAGYHRRRYRSYSGQGFQINWTC